MHRRTLTITRWLWYGRWSRAERHPSSSRSSPKELACVEDTARARWRRSETAVASRRSPSTTPPLFNTPCVLCVVSLLPHIYRQQEHTRTYVLWLLVEHRLHTTCLHLILSYAAAFIFLQLLYLKLAVHISFFRSLFQLYIGRPLPLWPCNQWRH